MSLWGRATDVNGDIRTAPINMVHRGQDEQNHGKSWHTTRRSKNSLAEGKRSKAAKPRHTVQTSPCSVLHTKCLRMSSFCGIESFARGLCLQSSPCSILLYFTCKVRRTCQGHAQTKQRPKTSPGKRKPSNKQTAKRQSTFDSPSWCGWLAQLHVVSSYKQAKVRAAVFKSLKVI